MKRLLLVAALALLGYVGWQARWQPTYEAAELERLRTIIEAEVRTWVAEGRLARPDGFVYAVDVAQLAEHAARARDRALYDQLTRVGRGFVIDRAEDPYTQGMVAWRLRPGVAPDASGTTEGLRMARALWRGAEAFGLPADRALAERLVEAWLRHATVDHGVWMVRNYFNLGTRAFANDSFMIDYDADFVARAGRGKPAWQEAAARSVDLTRAARAPSGLLRSMVQGDVRTLMPKLDVRVFAPNDVVQLNNVCTVAETVVEQAPELGRGVLDFARQQPQPLRRYFRAETGAPVHEAEAEITSMTCLARLAARLGEPEARADFAYRAVFHWRTFSETWPSPRAYTASEVLLAIDALLERRES